MNKLEELRDKIVNTRFNEMEYYDAISDQLSRSFAELKKLKEHPAENHQRISELEKTLNKCLEPMIFNKFFKRALDTTVYSEDSTDEVFDRTKSDYYKSIEDKFPNIRKYIDTQIESMREDFKIFRQMADLMTGDGNGHWKIHYNAAVAGALADNIELAYVRALKANEKNRDNPKVMAQIGGIGIQLAMKMQSGAEPLLRYSQELLEKVYHSETGELRQIAEFNLHQIHKMTGWSELFHYRPNKPENAYKLKRA